MAHFHIVKRIRDQMQCSPLEREAADCIEQLQADCKFLLSFAPTDVKVPAGLFPTFYHTLSHEGDQELADRINKIKSSLPPLEKDGV